MRMRNKFPKILIAQQILMILACAGISGGCESKWEYRCIDVNDVNAHRDVRATLVEPKLNKLGAQGWEAVGADNVQWCLKRRK